MMKYIKNNYNIDRGELIELIKKNYRVSKYENITVIYFDNNSTVNLNTEKKENNQVKLDILLRLVNYGNLEIQGTNIFTKVVRYIIDNLGGIYDYMRIKSLVGR